MRSGCLKKVTKQCVIGRPFDGVGNDHPVRSNKVPENVVLPIKCEYVVLPVSGSMWFRESAAWWVTVAYKVLKVAILQRYR